MIEFDIKRCPHCGHEIDYTANTCSECESELPEGASYCPSCGHDVTDVYLECENCGRVITEEDMEAFNKLTEAEQEEHVRPLREELEAREREYELYLAKRKKERIAERKTREEEQKAKAADDAALIEEVTQLAASHVDEVKYVKLEQKRICVCFIHEGLTYRIIINAEDWKASLTKLLASIKHLPADVRYYKIDMLGR
jgi:hypothetical protein